jgi:hypothetical protein
MFHLMDTFTSSDDALDHEIAARDADLARSLAGISETESHLIKLKQDMEILAVEVRTLKRAAGLRPAGTMYVAASPAPAAAVAARTFTTPNDIPAPAPQQVGRFRDVVDQIRAGR